MTLICPGLLTTEGRLGDGIAFNDRQILLQVLYDNLKDKNKVLIGKRVAKVSTSDSGASVETRDGEVFSGDIVVGLDGIRSTVRAEMWRIAAEAAPGYFPKDEMKREAPPGTALTSRCSSGTEN